MGMVSWVESRGSSCIPAKTNTSNSDGQLENPGAIGQGHFVVVDPKVCQHVSSP